MPVHDASVPVEGLIGEADPLAKILGVDVASISSIGLGDWLAHDYFVGGDATLDDFVDRGA